VLKNRNDPELSETNGRARLIHSKPLRKNVRPMTLALFLFTDENIFTVASPKPTE